MSGHRYYLEGLLKHVAEAISRVVDSDLGWVLKICICNKLPSNADAAGKNKYTLRTNH